MIPHHRFRLADPEHGMEVSDSIEVHTLELTKYNLQEETISSAPAIEQWAFFFLFADGTSRSGCGNCCRESNFSKRFLWSKRSRPKRRIG
jgi:hypothetical protein